MAACPRWVASYGVMPHVYIVTTGPGSNGTTSAAGAVHHSRIVISGMLVNFTATRVL